MLFTIHCSLFTASADEITSRAALVMEASTGRILFAKNPTLKLPPASTTKLVTAMVVLDRAQLNDTVTISEKAAKVPTLKETRFKEGEAVSVETLLSAALIRSANDAAFALAEAVASSEEKFVELMNKKVVAIGASDTKFINTTGLPGSGQRTTAYDLAKIMRHALKYPVIKEIIGTKETEISTNGGRTISLENTNRLLWSDEGAVGGKTGYTRAARHCFTYAGQRNGETVIVALLGAPSRTVLWNEAERLEVKGFEVISSNEQPVVYFTRADYEKSLKSSPWRSGRGDKVQSSRVKRYSKDKAKIIKASSTKRLKTVRVKNKAKLSAKGNKKTKDARIARGQNNGSKG